MMSQCGAKDQLWGVTGSHEVISEKFNSRVAQTCAHRGLSRFSKHSGESWHRSEEFMSGPEDASGHVDTSVSQFGL